jgi:hypothetical protein
MWVYVGHCIPRGPRRARMCCLLRVTSYVCRDCLLLCCTSYNRLTYHRGRLSSGTWCSNRIPTFRENIVLYFLRVCRTWRMHSPGTSCPGCHDFETWPQDLLCCFGFLFFSVSPYRQMLRECECLSSTFIIHTEPGYLDSKAQWINKVLKKTTCKQNCTTLPQNIPYLVTSFRYVLEHQFRSDRETVAMCQQSAGVDTATGEFGCGR